MRKENTMEQHDSTEAPLCGCCKRVPLSHLSLDVDEPVSGWLSYFAERGVTVMDDHLGRASIERPVLGALIAEQRDREARVLEEAAAKAATPEQPVVAGVPAIEDGDAYASLMAAGSVSPAQEFGGIPRPNSSRRNSRKAQGARRPSEKPSDGGRRRHEHREREGVQHEYRAVRLVPSVVRRPPSNCRRSLSVQVVPRASGREPSRAASSRHEEGGYPWLTSPAFSAWRRDGPF
jgi:hypothetical protein